MTKHSKPDFCLFLPDLSGKILNSGSGKLDTRSRNLFVLKHIWVKVSISWEFQPNRSNNTLKTGFFRISGKSGSRIRIFFGLKPSRDQDGANKKKFSQIGPAVPEEIGNRQTNKHTNIVLLYNLLAASPLASSGFAAIGDWKGLCPFQTSIYTIFWWLLY